MKKLIFVVQESSIFLPTVKDKIVLWHSKFDQTLINKSILSSFIDFNNVVGVFRWQRVLAFIIVHFFSIQLSPTILISWSNKEERNSKCWIKRWFSSLFTSHKWRGQKRIDVTTNERFTTETWETKRTKAVLGKTLKQRGGSPHPAVSLVAIITVSYNGHTDSTLAMYSSLVMCKFGWQAAFLLHDQWSRKIVKCFLSNIISGRLLE